MNSTLYLKKPIDAEMNRFATAEGSISAKPWALAHGTHSKNHTVLKAQQKITDKLRSIPEIFLIIRNTVCSENLP